MSGLYRLLALVALIAGLSFGVQAYHQHVYDEGHADAIAERKVADDKQLAAATKDVHAKEKALTDVIYKKALERAQEKARYENQLSDLRAAARRGNSGMRAPGSCLRANATPADPTAAGRPGAEEGFVLLPETAGSVLDAASELRQGVLDRNALIDEYNRVRATCNAVIGPAASP